MTTETENRVDEAVKVIVGCALDAKDLEGGAEVIAHAFYQIGKGCAPLEISCVHALELNDRFNNQTVFRSSYNGSFCAAVGMSQRILHNLLHNEHSNPDEDDD